MTFFSPERTLQCGKCLFIRLKGCYFHEIEITLALMNVLLYVKFLIDHAKIKTLVYFSTMFTHSF